MIPAQPDARHDADATFAADDASPAAGLVRSSVFNSALPEQPFVALVGAGVSMLPPACMPGWRQIHGLLLDGLFARVPGGAQPGWRRVIDDREAAGRLPSEYLAEVVARRLPDQYFELLRGLDGTTPTPVHRALAQLAADGRLAAIVTTNFDRLTEVAFDEAGIPLRRCVVPADYEAWMADPGGVALFKPHGCAGQPGTLVDTLAQRKRGLAPAIADALRRLHARHPWVVLGSSGADLDANPNHLLLRETAPDSPGMLWLTRPGDDLRAGVAAHADRLGERFRRVEGTLPGWLAPDCEAPATDAGVSRVVLTHVTEWSATVPTTGAALAIADLLQAAAAPRDAVAVLDQLAASLHGSREVYASPDDWLRDRASCEGARANVRRALGETAAARAHGDCELAAWEELGDEAGIARAQTNAAATRESSGDFDEARRLYEAALATKRALGDAAGEAYTLAGLATLDRRQGHYDDARARFETVVAIKTTIGDEPGRGMALSCLAGIEQSQGRFDESIARYHEALAVFDRLGDDFSRSMTLTGLAIVHRRRGDFDASAELYEQALPLKEALGDARGIAGVHLGLAALQRMRGNLPDGIRHGQAALDGFTAIGDRHGQAMANNSLAQLHRAAGNLDAAESHFEASRACKEELGDRHGLSMTLNGLALLCRDRGDLAAARQHIRAAIRLKRDLGDGPGRVESERVFALCLLDAGNRRAAAHLLRRVIAACQSTNPPLAEAAMADLAECE